MELALFSFGVQLELNHPFEDLSDLLDVFLQGVGVDQDVIDVYNNKSVEHVSEDVINKGLEDGRTIDQV